METEIKAAQEQLRRTQVNTSPGKTSAILEFFKSKSQKLRNVVGPTKKFRNPYLNFLHEFRKRNLGLSQVEVIRRGAKEWKKLPKQTKLKYIEEASKIVTPSSVSVNSIPSPIDCGCKPKRKSRCRKKKTRKRKCGKKRRVKKRRGCKRRRRRKRC